jgi:hypothetical protein
MEGSPNKRTLMSPRSRMPSGSRRSPTTGHVKAFFIHRVTTLNGGRNRSRQNLYTSLVATASGKASSAGERHGFAVRVIVLGQTDDTQIDRFDRRVAFAPLFETPVTRKWECTRGTRVPGGATSTNDRSTATRTDRGISPVGTRSGASCSFNVC